MSSGALNVVFDVISGQTHISSNVVYQKLTLMSIWLNEFRIIKVDGFWAILNESSVRFDGDGVDTTLSAMPIR